MARIIIARHGQTAFNSGAAGENERIRGWLDVPLNINGMMEAKGLASKVNQYPITDVVSSDLSRARQTANMIAAPRGIMVSSSPSLRPWNLGSMQGTSVKSAIPKMEQYINNPTNIPSNGEPFDAFRNRYLGFLSRVMDFTKGLDRNVVLTTHTRNAKLTHAWLANGQKPDFSIDNKVMTNYDDQTHTGNFFSLMPGNSGKWQIEQGDNSPAAGGVAQTKHDATLGIN